jgi:hypothetical protein
MKQIEEQDEEAKNIAHSTLTWIANAKRPLTALELQTALAIEPGSKSLDKENILAIEVILSVCAGLVIMDDQLSVVRLVHHTTQEYLDRIQLEIFPNAQTEITRSLLTYLAFDLGSSINSSYSTNDSLPPLFLYSQYCLAHATGPPEDLVRGMILKFLAQVAEWTRQRRDKWGTQPWNYSDWPKQPSALWVAAAANLVKTCGFFACKLVACSFFSFHFGGPGNVILQSW